MFTLTILRHGESQGNAAGLLQGQADYPLTQNGLVQVKAVAETWRCQGKFFAGIISSPLMRARQTAEIIAESLGLSIEYDPLWMERNFGVLSGLRPEELSRDGSHPFMIHPYQAFGTTGESKWELYLRAGQALQKTLSKLPAEYLIVSHGGILNMVVYTILGIVPQANSQGARFPFDNTSFATFTYQPEKHIWTMVNFIHPTDVTD
jgi:broad specificity phosphatase PhoE